MPARMRGDPDALEVAGLALVRLAHERLRLGVVDSETDRGGHLREHVLIDQQAEQVALIGLLVRGVGGDFRRDAGVIALRKVLMLIRVLCTTAAEPVLGVHPAMGMTTAAPSTASRTMGNVGCPRLHTLSGSVVATGTWVRLAGLKVCVSTAVVPRLTRRGRTAGCR